MPPVRLLEPRPVDASERAHAVDEFTGLRQAQYFTVVENQGAQNQILPSSALGPKSGGSGTSSSRR
jgi:hypothetical protein